MKQRERTEQKRREAEERNTDWANLSPDAQIEHLDKYGFTATKQRERIAGSISSDAPDSKKKKKKKSKKPIDILKG
jgi:hypothetical protein